MILRTVSLLLFVVLSLIPDFGRADHPFRHQFKKGEVQKQQLVMKQQMKMKIPGQPAQELSVTQSMDISLTCDEVSDEGVAVLRQRMNRVRAKFEGLPNQPKALEYDTQLKDQGNHPVIVQLEKVMRPMTGVDWTMKMNSLGQITDVSVPQDVVDAIANSGVAALGDMFSEQGLRSMSEQSGIQFPEKNLKLNDNWTTPIELKSAIGIMKMERTLTYVGSDGESGKEKFDVKVAMELIPDPASVVKLTLKSGSGEGTILFDREKGRAHENKVTSVVEMEIPIGAVKMEQSIITSVHLKDMTEASDAQ